MTHESYVLDNADRFPRIWDPDDPNNRFGPWQYLRFGFVAGCIWGDDSSWKIEVLDLAGVIAGTLRREARFGCCELPYGRSLRDALDFGPGDRPRSR